MSSNMKLTGLNKGQALQALDWREKQRDVLRTPYFLTQEMQSKFFDDVVCNRNSPHRFYAIIRQDEIIPKEQIDSFVGMGGLINIEWENSTAELSLITPIEEYRKIEMFDLLFDDAFNRLNLNSVYVETYECGDMETSMAVIKKYEAYSVELPERKFLNGIYYKSIWWMVNRGMYENCR